jgi:hypothetical protein
MRQVFQVVLAADIDASSKERAVGGLNRVLR